MSKKGNLKRVFIAEKAIELGHKIDVGKYREAAVSGENDLAMDPLFLRDFALAYLEAMKADPEVQGSYIRYKSPDKNGVDCSQAGVVYWKGLSEYENQAAFNDIDLMVRDFEKSGHLRQASDIAGRPVGECALALLKARLGEKWFSSLSKQIANFYKIASYQNKIGNGGNLYQPFTNYHRVGHGISVKLSGKRLLILADFKKITYKNATLTIRGEVPESFAHSVKGKSLKDLVSGLPNEKCFDETIAISATRTQSSLSIDFEEKQIPLKET